MKQSFIWLALVAGVLLMAPAAQAGTFASNDTITLDSQTTDDAYLAGSHISVKAPITGDAFIAGDQLSLTGDIARSLFAAGNQVTVSGNTAHNGFVAGSQVDLSGTYGHDLFVAGQSIDLAKTSLVSGDLRIVGRDVVLHGHIMGDVWVAGQSVTSDATIDGTLTADVSTITFTGGKVGGDFVYGNGQTVKDTDRVTISGTTSQKDFPSAPKTPNQRPFRAMTILVKLLSGLVLGIILLLATPQLVIETRDGFVANWARSFGFGLLALIVLPIASVLIMLTGIGLAAGFVGLLLYVVLLMVAAGVMLFVLGNLIIHRGANKGTNTDWWLSLLVGTLVFAVATNLPALGGLLATILFAAVTLPVIGALLIAAWNRLSHAH